MNSAEKPQWDADSLVSRVLRRSPVFRISKPFLSKFITPSRRRDFEVERAVAVFAERSGSHGQCHCDLPLFTGYVPQDRPVPICRATLWYTLPYRWRRGTVS